MVADKLQKQEEERIRRSPTCNVDNMAEEEMDVSAAQHKRKVAPASVASPKLTGKDLWSKMFRASGVWVRSQPAL